MEVYSVVGPKDTSEHYNTMMTKIASIFEDDGYILRTRGREGFEEHAVKGVDLKQNKVFIPGGEWNNGPSQEAYSVAWDHSNKWLDLSEENKKRSAYIVQVLLGAKLNNRSQFLITYTQDEETIPEVILAMRVAKHYGIRVFDLAEYSFQKLWNDILSLQKKVG